MTTPLIRYLARSGNELSVLTSDQGEEIYRNNPYISKLLIHKKDSVPNDKLTEYFKDVQKKEGCQKLIDLCESVECKIIFHPNQPQYNYHKQYRQSVAEINMYEDAFSIAGIDIDPDYVDLTPEVFFSSQEEGMWASWKSGMLDKRVVLWGLSGSGLHKSYPYVPYVIDTVLKRTSDVVFVTVGDIACQILELDLQHPRVINRSGVWSFRESMIAAKYASAVVSSETGISHAAGCFDTPQLILYSHTNHECLGKHFRNATPFLPNVACAPCFRLIYNSHVQCPHDPVTTAPLCMSDGIDPDELVESLCTILDRKESRILCQK